MRDLLREYVAQICRDASFMNGLRGSGLCASHDTKAEELAEGWLEDMHLVTGEEVPPGTRSQVVRFVEGTMPGLLERFRGNVDAARLTMFNMLDAEFGK